MEYIEGIKNFFKEVPPIVDKGKEEEIELFLDPARKSEFLCGYLRLVFKIAKDSHRGQASLEDKIGYGCIGLLEAYDKFEPKKGCRFSTFAYLRIHRGIQRGIRQGERLVRLPEWIYVKRILAKKGRPITNNETERIREAAMTDFVSSLDEPMSHVCEGLSRADMGSIPYEPDCCEEVDRKYRQMKIKDIIEKLVSKLPKEEKEVISTYYGIGRRKETLGEISKRANRSVTTVKNYIKTAKRRMRAECQSIKGLRDLV